MPGNKMEWGAVGLARIQQRRQDSRFWVGQRRPAYAGFRIGPQDCCRSMLIVLNVARRLESIRAAAVLPDIRFIGHFPIANAGLSFLVVADKLLHQFLPRPVIVWLDDVLVDLWKQGLWLETNAHQRLGPRLENRFHGLI